MVKEDKGQMEAVTNKYDDIFLDFGNKTRQKP